MPKIADKTTFMNAVREMYGEVQTVSRTQVLEIMEKYGLTMPSWLVNDPKVRAGRGLYYVNGTINANGVRAARAARFIMQPPVAARVDTVPVAQVSETVETAPSIDQTLAMAGMGIVHELNLVPSVAPGYVPFGHFNDVRAIITSRKFYPVYVTGLSGNGKTLMIEQAAAQEGRECIRVNVTIETDEDDLIGGFRLIDGRTVWQNGPVVVAMERGAILLLDEVDLGSNKLMCLQPILEGRPLYLKKVNRTITPAPGFNVFATANTKGKGSMDGRFIGTNIMNEAFLERFSITLEQEYPEEKTEVKILMGILPGAALDFAKNLVTWANVIRKSFYEDAVPEIISTRRLVHISEAFNIFGDQLKAIELCLNRFDVDTKNSFLDLYKKLVEVPVPVVAPVGSADPGLAGPQIKAAAGINNVPVTF